MEGLNVALKSAVEKGIFKGINIPVSAPMISHIFYADDVLFVGEWSHSNLINLARILKSFHVSSRLKVNFHKSRVFGIGANPQETTKWASILGCEAGSLPFNYLGVPVGANMNLKKHWKPIIKKFHSMLSSWKAKSLSFGGRLNLVKSILGNLPTYLLSIFMAPTGVVEKLEAIRRKFLWGGNKNERKIHRVSWDKVTASKEDGGLGVGSIRALNIGIIVKWWWRLKHKSSSLWSWVINGIHNLTGEPFDHLSNKNIPGVWNNIACAKKEIQKRGMNVPDIFRLMVKSGEKTLFWHDAWVGDKILKVKYPDLYNLDLVKNCSVAQKIPGNEVSWRSCPLSGGSEQELGLLYSDMASTRLMRGDDYWHCILATDGEYKVELLRTKIDHIPTSNPTPSIIWCKEVPIKVIGFMWRAIQGRIPTAMALSHRGIVLYSSTCGSCIGYEEDVNHLLISCHYAHYIWDMVFMWCGVNNPQFSGVGDLFNYANN